MARLIECAGGIVTNPDWHVLVVKNQIGKCTLPKGTRKPNEGPRAAALREVGEESGLSEIEIVRYLGPLIREGFTADNAIAPSVIKQIQMYHFLTAQTELDDRLLASDIVHAEWVPEEQLPHVLDWGEETGFFLQHRETIMSERLGRPFLDQ